MPRSIDNHGLIRKIGTSMRTVSERPKHSDADPNAFSEELEQHEAEPEQDGQSPGEEERHPLLRPRDPQETDLAVDLDDESDVSNDNVIYDPQTGSERESNELGRGRSVDLEA